MFSDKLLSPLSAPLPRFLPVLVSVFFTVPCTHQDQGLQVSLTLGGEGLRSAEASNTSKRSNPVCSLLRPLSASADPEKRRFQAVSKRDQHSWLGASIAWLTAWAVKMEVLDQ